MGFNWAEGEAVVLIHLYLESREPGPGLGARVPGEGQRMERSPVNGCVRGALRWAAPSKGCPGTLGLLSSLW